MAKPYNPYYIFEVYPGLKLLKMLVLGIIAGLVFVYRCLFQRKKA